VQPTAAGRTLLHHARQVLQQMAHLRGDMASHGAGLAGHVRLLCNTSALGEHLPPLLPAFLAAHPRVSVELEERASQDIADAVRCGLAELGVASDAVDLQGLETLPFRPDPLVLAVPAGHALAAARSATLAQALDEDFVGLPAGTALQALVNTQARRLGKALNYRARLSHLEAVCRLVGLGAGVAVVPQAAARRHARALRIQPVRLADAWARRSLVLCMQRLAELPPFTRQLVAHLQMA
jgi:DNA-binding transcriptional LysR family regulator